MSKCKNEKRPKHLAYGQKYNGNNNWCLRCDSHSVISVSKKRERQEAKREIEEELDKEFGEVS